MKATLEFRNIDVDSLVPNPLQPRESFNKESLRELANSLISRGEIQPIVVRKHKNGYQIIAGERRWRAAKLAGLKTVPVLIKDTAEEDVLLESLIENLHRLDLTSTERGNAVYELWKSKRWKTYAELSNALGKNEGWVQSHIAAAEIRKKEKLAASFSTRTITDTATLEPEERKQILAKVEKEEIRAEQVRDYARAVKEAPPTVVEALLKPKSRITPIVAKSISQLSEEKQPEAIEEVESLRLTPEEAIAHVELMKQEIPLPPPEEIEKIRGRYEELQKEFKAKLDTPEAKERGENFKTWTAHIAVMGLHESLSCPICKSKQLGWLCHNLPIDEALKVSEEKYKKATKMREDVT